MSSSSVFRLPGDNLYRWPPEGVGFVEREYPRVSTFLSKGEPQQQWLKEYATSHVADRVIDNVSLIHDYAVNSFNELGREFYADQKWWDNELEQVAKRDQRQKEKIQRWDEGERFQKTKPREGNSLNNALTKTPPQKLRAWLKSAPDEYRNQAAETGTAVHSILEAMAADYVGDAKAFDRYSKYTDFIDSAINFFNDYDPKFIEVESVVYSDKYGYAGQFDGIAEIDGKTIWIDWKTGDKGIKPTIALQLSAYASADFIGRADGTKDKLPHIDEFWGVSIRRDDYDVVKVDVNDDTKAAWLTTMDMHHWITQLSPKVLSKPLPKPVAELMEAI